MFIAFNLKFCFLPMHYFWFLCAPLSQSPKAKKNKKSQEIAGREKMDKEKWGKQQMA